MDRFINHMIDELDSVERNPYLEREEKDRARIRVVKAIVNNKQNELMKTMNSVANKFIKWSLAKDKFISEVVSYSSTITSKINTGEITPDEALRLLDKELADLRKQDESMTRQNVKQAIVVKLAVDAKAKKLNGRIDENIKITVASIGFVTAGLQFVAGVGMVSSGVGIAPGALMIAHGVNNFVENGYYILYRKDYTGPVRFVYEGIGEKIGLSKRDSDVVYTSVDIALSVNALLSYKLAEDATRLYRYVNADLLWGLKEMGVNNMSTGEIIVEIGGDINTAYSQARNY